MSSVKRSARRIWPWLILLLLASVVFGLIWSFRPNQSSTLTEANHATTADFNSSSQTTSDSAALLSPPSVQTGSVSSELPSLAPSLQGTDIDCPLEIRAEQLVLTIGIRQCFDYFLSSVGEKTEAQIVSDIRQYLNVTLPVPAANEASRLLTQYVSYKHAEQRFDGQADGQDAQALQKLLTSVMQLRRQYFSPAEAEALFGREEVFNQYTLQQMQIHANSNLTAAQKAAQLALLLSSLPADLAEGIRTSSQYANLQQLTQDMKKQQATPAQITAMRTQLVGAEAAQRLGQLDQTREVWRQKIQAYLVNRQAIINRIPAGTDRTDQIQALRERSFGDVAERTRAQAYEAMADRGEAFPE